MWIFAMIHSPIFFTETRNLPMFNLKVGVAGLE